MSSDPRLMIRTSSETALESLTDDLRQARVPVSVGLEMEASRRSGTTNTKAVDPQTLGLAITISFATVKVISNIVIAWIGRQRSRTVVLEVQGNRIEVTAASASGQRAAMEAWLSAAAAVDGPDQSRDSRN
ncbi:hypothetical protein [Actinoplanes sp. GCM10030250]|uniref:hypothetical protein n=1 Tax=Actinoplanes sp. GCM10030250 TaxID=3273376 RepID=UPI00360A133B